MNNRHDISGMMPWHKPYIVSAGNLNVLKQSTNFQNWGSELSGLKISSSLSLSAISITSSTVEDLTLQVRSYSLACGLDHDLL